MTSYCIYLYCERTDSYENAGVFGKEQDAMLVAQNLKDLIEKGLLFETWNDFQYPFVSVEIRKYSNTDTITTGELIEV